MATAVSTFKHEVRKEHNGGMYVTMCINNQMFGIEVKHVRDVLLKQKITTIPLSPPEIAGSLNLRGRIVTVIDLHKRLNLPEAAARKNGKELSNTFVVVDHKGELYSLIVDSVGEVLMTSDDKIEKVPANLNSSWQAIASGIYKLDGELVVLVNVQSLLQF